MNTVEAPLSAVGLVLCLAGKLGVTPALMVETIKGEPELLEITNAYGRGEVSYSDIAEAVANYF